jgi:hypothetical protein
MSDCIGSLVNHHRSTIQGCRSQNLKVNIQIWNLSTDATEDGPYIVALMKCSIAPVLAVQRFSNHY